MSLGWINPEAYSFHSFLMMERFQIRLMLDSACASEEMRRNLGLALSGNPCVTWYFCHKCPERTQAVKDVLAQAAEAASAEEIRRAEIAVIGYFEDFVVYCYPKIMATHCDFIRDWDPKHLHALADFTDKIVLDVGSGSGRLAFAAAAKARHVYASEPVDSLREFMRDRILREGIANVTVVDGMAACLPYPDDLFDIVMSGHVIGDELDRELAELMRVVRSGGLLLDCQGDRGTRADTPSQELIARGFACIPYISSGGAITYTYRKQICK